MNNDPVNRPTPASPARNDDHSWVRRRLVAAAAGLLTAPEDERMRAHLAACEECTEAWREATRALSGEGAGADSNGERHLSPAMIARWETAAQDLRGLEREAVRDHLERCPDCRADLAALGHRPELAMRPTLVRRGRSSRSFGAGLAWGVGVTALAAVVTGLMLMPQRATRENALLPWVAPITLRGASPASLDLAADAAGFTILVSLPAEFDFRRTAAVTVLDPAGRRLLHTDLPPQEQAGRPVSLVIGDLRNLTAGDYRVVFRQSPADGPSLEQEVGFRINLMAP